MPCCGILPVDKGAGWTSHDVVAVVRKLTQTKRVGHAGTLDPAATGVLPVFVGPATRFIEYLQGQPKEYLATVRLGEATTTYDAEGEVVETLPVPDLDETTVVAVLKRFTGQIEQRPPAFSALKVQGRRAYELARRGELAQLPPRAVEIEALELLGLRPRELDLRVCCSAGTYVRSLAHDLAHALGTAGHLLALRRTRVGPFHVGGCLTIEALRSAAEEGSLPLLLVGVDEAMLANDAAVLGPEHASGFQHGIRVSCPPAEHPEVRVYEHGGRFLGSGAISQGVLRPLKVLAG